MKSIIHKYLYEYFIFVQSKIRSKSVYLRSKETYINVYYNDSLSNIIDELSLIFAMTKKQLKYYIKSWVRKHNRGFDFERYWNPPSFSLVRFQFPMIRGLQYRTISMDLAAVEPMEGPRGIIATWEHVVNQPELVANFERHTNRVVDSRFYGTMNHQTRIENATTIEQVNQLREEVGIAPIERIIDLWDRG